MEHRFVYDYAVSRLCSTSPLTVPRHRISVEMLSRWRDEFIYTGTAALKSCPTDLTEARLKEARAKIGNLTTRLEIAETYLRERSATVEEVKAVIEEIEETQCLGRLQRERVDLVACA